MLTQEQSDALNVQQHALEAAQIGYGKTQADLDRYNSILTTIKDNYNSYSPEMKTEIARLLPEISQKYNQLKTQKEQYITEQHEAQQQIDYYNNLNAQQGASYQRTGRRIIPTPTPSPIPETIIEQAPTDTLAPLNMYSPLNTYSPANTLSPSGQFNFSVPGWISTVNGPRYVGTNTGAQSGQTRPIDYSTYQTTVQNPYQTTISNPIPYEISRVQNAYGNDYLKGMDNLERLGYNVVNQRAYKNGQSWNLK